MTLDESLAFAPLGPTVEEIPHLTLAELVRWGVRFDGDGKPVVRRGRA